MKQQSDKRNNDQFRWYFDEQFPGPFADIYTDDLGPVVVFPEPAPLTEEGFTPKSLSNDELL